MNSIGWETTELGNVIELYDHKRIPLSGAERSTRQGEFPYYGASGVIDFIDDYIFSGRYLLIAEDGENLNSRKTPIAFFASGKFWVNNHAHIVRAIDGLADDYFLKAWFDHADISGYITGAAQPKLSQANLKKIEIRLPPIASQRKIAAVLSAYDDLIENNNRRIAILEEMVQLLYREWFVHFRFPGHESVPMVESELGLIPEGWTWSTLGNVASEVRRTVQPSDIAGETPYIGLAHMPRRSITLSEWGRADEVSSTKLQFKTGEILFGKIRPYFHKVGVAPVDGVCSSDIIVVRPSEERWMALTLCCVSSDAFVEHASQTSQGTKMPRADWNLLVRYPLAVPPESQLGWFNETVGAVVDLLLNFIAKNIVLRTSRDILLPNILSGEWDIDNINLA